MVKTTKVLITGISGLLGSTYARYLITKGGYEVAWAVQNVTIGRQILEGDLLYSFPTPDEAKQLLKKFSHKLSSEELVVLNEIVEIQRKINPVYGY